MLNLLSMTYDSNPTELLSASAIQFLYAWTARAMWKNAFDLRQSRRFPLPPAVYPQCNTISVFTGAPDASLR